MQVLLSPETSSKGTTFLSDTTKKHTQAKFLVERCVFFVTCPHNQDSFISAFKVILSRLLQDSALPSEPRLATRSLRMVPTPRGISHDSTSELRTTHDTDAFHAKRTTSNLVAY